MIVKRSPARDSSEDSVLLLPREKSAAAMLGLGTSTKEGLKLSQRVAYGMGHVLNDICSAMWFSYTLLFFEVVLKMPSSIAGGMICVGQVADAVASPIIGIFIDRYGTRKSWHLLGTTLLAFTYPLMFSNCPWMPDVTLSVTNSTNETQNVVMTSTSWEHFDTTQMVLGAIYITFLVSIFQSGWAMTQIAHLAIIPDLTPDKTERANLTAIRCTANVVAYVFVFLLTWFVLHITEGNKTAIGVGDAYKFKAIVLLGILIGGICTMFFHAVLKTPHPDSASTTKDQTRKGLGSWWKVIKEYFKSYLLYQVTIVYFTSRMITCISLIYMPLYLVEKVGKEAEYIATVPLASYVASFVASLMVRQVRTCSSSKVNYIVGAVVSIVASIWIGWGYTYDGELFGIAILLGAGASITSVASLCLCADLIGTDTENGAFVYSVVTAVDKLLGGVAVIVIEVLKTRMFALSTHYYQDVLAYGCGISGVLGLVVLITMFCNSKAEKN